MIHSGAIIGAGIPQFKSIILKFIKFPYPYFRSDRCVKVCLVNVIIFHVQYVAERSVTLYLVELLLEWQLPLGLQLEECCLVWKKDLPSGTRHSPGGRYIYAHVWFR